jgi:hypothetical protein
MVYIIRRIWALLSSGLGQIAVAMSSKIKGWHVVKGIYYPSQQSTNFLEQPIFDLENLVLQTPPLAVELVSFPFGDDQSAEPNIACFALNNGRGYNYSSYFIRDISLALKAQTNKPRLVINEPAYLLPYMTTHFGHFTGDCLGSIIAFSHRIPSGPRKLYVLYPAALEQSIKNQSSFDCLVKIDTTVLNQNNILFTDAKVLPQLSPWQNLCLAQQIYRKLHTPSSVKYEKVFLTSQRPDRISNVSEVAAHLRSKGFFILNPSAHFFEETLSIIRQCDCLITENGSITHNVLIARTAPYLVLTSAKGLTLNASEFAGGGIFNAFNSYHAQHLICQPHTDKQSHHAYSTQIYVDIADLDQAISKLNKLAFN